MQATKSVEYRIEYNPETAEECGVGVNPDPLVIESNPTSTAMDIMELAVNEGTQYRFKATYFGVSTGGYFIDAINGTSNSDTCFWFFYILPPDSAEFRPNVGVSTYIPGSDFIMTLRYETFQPIPTPQYNTTLPTSQPTRTPQYYNTTLTIQYPDPRCPTATPPDPITVSIDQGSNVLTLMEQAVNIGGRPYRFSGTFFETPLGLFIDTLNNVSNNSSEECYWIYYIDPPNGDEFETNLGVSSYIIPGNNYDVIWRYRQSTPIPGGASTAKIAPLSILVMLLVTIICKVY